LAGNTGFGILKTFWKRSISAYLRDISVSFSAMTISLPIEKYLWAWKKFYSFRKRPLQSVIHRYVASKWHRANRETVADLAQRFER
jgi:hypothetical protein